MVVKKCDYRHRTQLSTFNYNEGCSILKILNITSLSSSLLFKWLQCRVSLAKYVRYQVLGSNPASGMKSVGVLRQSPFFQSHFYPILKMEIMAYLINLLLQGLLRQYNMWQKRTSICTYWKNIVTKRIGFEKNILCTKHCNFMLILKYRLQMMSILQQIYLEL